MLKKVIVRLVGIFIIAPVVMVSLFWATFAMAKIHSFLLFEQAATDAVVAAHVHLGINVALVIIGITTVLNLYDHFLVYSYAPKWADFATIGLIFGSAASLRLVETVALNSILFVLPALSMLGLIIFMWILFSAPPYSEREEHD